MKLNYNQNGRCFDRTYCKINKSATKFLLIFIPNTRFRRILDIGAGTGLNTVDYLAKGYRVVAVEPNPNMRDVLEKKVGTSDGVEIYPIMFENADLGDRRFNTVNLRNVLYLIKDPKTFLKKAFNHTHPGGRIIISGPKPSLPENYRKFQRLISAEIDRNESVGTIGWQETLVSAISGVILANTTIHQYELNEVISMLREAGYTDVIYASDTGWMGILYFVVAKRP